MSDAPHTRESLPTPQQQHAELWLQGQNEVLRQLVAEAPLPDLLRTIACSLERLIHGAIGSILLLDDGGQRLRLGAAPHLPEPLNRALDGMAIGPQAGACGAAAFSAEPVVIEDFEADPRGVAYRELSRQYGLRACWSRPVLAANGAVLGTFALYFREPRRPGPDEQRLIAEAGNLAAVAIETTRNRAGLAEREERFRRLFEQASDAIFVISADNRFLDVNASGLELTGYSREEFLHLGVADVLVAEEQPRLQVEPAEIMAGTPHLAEWEHRRKDGSTFRAEVSARQLNDDSYLAIVRDLSERLCVQAALRESEERLRLALDAAHMGSFDWDLGRDRIAWSRWHEELWGFAPGEFGGDFASFAARVHGDDLSGIEAEVARCIAAREPFVREFRVVWPDGSTHWIAGRGEFEFDADGRALNMRGVVKEISARKAAEARLQESVHQLRLFVQHSPAAIAMFDRDMRYLVASERWCDDYGLRDRELQGRSHYEVFPELPERWKAIHRRCLDGAVERCEEDPFPRADGRFDWVRWEIRPWCQTDGAIGGLIIFSEVITDRKLAQLQLVDYSARLELLSRRLLAAQESERRQVARELHDEIGQLLTVVKLDLQTVLQQPGSAALGEALREGMESIDRVVARVRDLSLDLRPSMLDDLGLLPTLRWYAQRQAQRLGERVEWRLQLPSDLPRLAGDIETACFRVAQEALTNVARHARASRIEVELTLRDQCLGLSVRDNGVGFAPGAGADASSQPGFGLLGMQERAELAGGRLRLESTPGRGTCVSAEFPAMPRPAPTP